MSTEQEAPKGAAAIKGGAATVEEIRADKVAPSPKPIAEADKAELVQMSVADFKAMLSEVVKTFNEEIGEMRTQQDKLVATLERESTVQNIKSARTGGPAVQVIGVNYTPKTATDIIEEKYKDKIDGTERKRWVNTRETLRSLRRAQGWTPILDEKGDEVRVGDTSLMKMSEERYQREVRGPQNAQRDDRRRATKESVDSDLRETAKRAGAQVVGPGIVYDEDKPS